MRNMDNAVPIPDRLRKRPRFQGMPIPYLTLVDSVTGIPDFKVNNEALRLMVIRMKRCGLCGEKLMGKKAFIGGPKCVESGLFIDPAMHVVCAQYAWDVCPFIVLGKGYATTLKEHAGATVEVLDIMSTSTPERMALLITTGYTSTLAGAENILLVRAVLPPVSVTWREYVRK